MRPVLVGLIALLACRCSGAETPSEPPPTVPAAAAVTDPTVTDPAVADPEVTDPADTDPTVTNADLEACVEETNRYRTSVGVSPVSRSPEVEAYAAAAARADHLSQTAHGYTNGPNRPSGAFAENEAVRWPRNASVRTTIERAMAMFWREGPGGGHYENLRGPWQRVGCGIYVDGVAITFVQHFR